VRPLPAANGGGKSGDARVIGGCVWGGVVMASVVEICNLALAKVGRGSINSLSEASPEAEVCGLFFPGVRDSLLRQFPWNFAARSALLGEVSAAIPEAAVWGHVYQYPGDALHVYRVFEAGRFAAEPANEFEVVGSGSNRYICCNVYRCYARYGMKVTDPTVFDPLFVEALVLKLAIELATEKDSSSRLRVLMTAFSAALERAMLAGALEGGAKKPRSQEAGSPRAYILARR